MFCKDKRIPGAFCVENIWVILSDAERQTNSQKSTSISFSVIGMGRIPWLLSQNAMLMLRSVNTARMILVTDKIFISELYGIRLFRYVVNSSWVWKEL